MYCIFLYFTDMKLYKSSTLVITLMYNMNIDKIKVKCIGMTFPFIVK